MYSKEQQTKAIKLYIKYGLKPAPVIHELGYPSENALRNWYNRYLKSGKYYDHKLRRSKYSEKDRKEAVEFYLTHGRNASLTRRTLGYPCKPVLTEWLSEDVKDYKPSPLKGKHFVKYSQEEKKEAALEVALRKKNVSKMAKEKNVSRMTLNKWNKELISNDLNQKNK